MQALCRNDLEIEFDYHPGVERFRIAISDASSSPRKVASASRGATYCSTSVKAFNEDPASNATIHSARFKRRDGLWRRCVAPLSSGRTEDCCSVGAVEARSFACQFCLLFLLVDGDATTDGSLRLKETKFAFER